MASSDTNLALRKIAEFEHVLVELITAWNRVENLLRGLLITLGNNEPFAYILVAELGNRGVKDGLLSIAAEAPMDGVERDAIKHAVDYFDRVLAYRNYYVHSIQGVVFLNRDKIAVGIADSVSAKSRFAVHQESVTLREIDLARTIAVNLGQALTELRLYFDPGVHGQLPPKDRLSGFRESYPLPDTLKKPRNYLLESYYQRQALRPKQ